MAPESSKVLCHTLFAVALVSSLNLPEVRSDITFCGG
jgi:hypothetical protein